MLMLREALLFTLTLVLAATQQQFLPQNVARTIVNNISGAQTNLQPLTSTVALPNFENRNVGPPAFSALDIEQTTEEPFDRAASIESSRRISAGAQHFALDLFTKFSDALQQNKVNRDFMISPFAVWSLLLLLTEAAAGNTLSQLRSSLHIDVEQAALRKAFRDVQTYLKINTSTIESRSLQSIFTDINQPVRRDFETIIERNYGSILMPVNFQDVNTTYHNINAEVAKATRGLIQTVVLPQDLIDAHLFLVSTLYFKGQWKHPFNKSLTRSEPFYDEDGNNIGNIEMMVQEANFNYAGMNELEAHVLELPYGKENRLSMLIILPKRGVSINKVTHNLQAVGIAPIFEKLAASAVGFEDEDVEVFLPKISTQTTLSLEAVLNQLGITEIFQPGYADLSKMSNDLFVSHIIHATQIIVNEEGTEAAAVTSAVLANKATPPKFYLNRPFLYLIMEKSTNLLLFAGQVTNPNNFK